MQSPEFCLSQVIGGIGTPDFASNAAKSVARHVGFDLSAIILHPWTDRPRVLFHDFDKAGCGAGVDTYARYTYRANPMLEKHGVVRACDFAGRAATAVASLHPYLLNAPEEELGYRTAGWPERQEEIGLYLTSSEGMIELGFYRPRRTTRVSDSTLGQLASLERPIAAAFDKDLELCRRSRGSHLNLTPRETEVLNLLVSGCSSDAIALRLRISRYTVKDHRKHIFQKLGVGTLAELFASLRAHPSREG